MTPFLPSPLPLSPLKSLSTARGCSTPFFFSPLLHFFRRMRVVKNKTAPGRAGVLKPLAGGPPPSFCLLLFSLLYLNSSRNQDGPALRAVVAPSFSPIFLLPLVLMRGYPMMLQKRFIPSSLSPLSPGSTGAGLCLQAMISSFPFLWSVCMG